MASNVKLLLVDDNPMVLGMLRQALTSLGQVTTAADAADALLKAVDDPPDLLVVDYRMPDLDGGTVARKLKEKNPSVPIVMFTGVDDIAPDALTAVNSLVKKGESPTALSDEVQRLLAF